MLRCLLCNLSGATDGVGRLRVRLCSLSGSTEELGLGLATELLGLALVGLGALLRLVL